MSVLIGEFAICYRLVAICSEAQMQLQLRSLRDKDSEPVKELIRKIWAEHFGNHPEALVRDYMNQPEVLADVTPTHYTEPQALFLVAETGSSICASGAFSRIDETQCELKRMYVATELRRQGVARSIAVALIRFAAQSGYETMRLSTNKALYASHRLYESLGFKPTASWDDEAAKYVLFYELALPNTRETATDSARS
jgi:GNAT superfamily N-acetyltransferase